VHALYGDHQVRFRPVENIIREIDTLVNKYQVRNIKIWDELFALNENRVLSICDGLKDYDLNIWAYARVDTVTERMLKAMKEAGINWLAYGFESADTQVRSHSRKRFTDSQVERAKEIVIGMLKKSQHETGVEKWPIIAKGQGGTQEVPGLAFDASQFVHGNKDSSWMQGVRYTFRSRIFLIPLGGGAQRINPLNDLELTSESWLGREVNFNECRDQMSNLGIWDNGC